MLPLSFNTLLNSTEGLNGSRTEERKNAYTHARNSRTARSIKQFPAVFEVEVVTLATNQLRKVMMKVPMEYSRLLCAVMMDPVGSVGAVTI